LKPDLRLNDNLMRPSLLRLVPLALVALSGCARGESAASTPVAGAPVVKDERLELSARNVPGVTVIRADSLNVVDVLDADVLLITRPSISTMSEVYA